jgi:uncharacterized protein YqkB
MLLIKTKIKAGRSYQLLRSKADNGFEILQAVEVCSDYATFNKTMVDSETGATSNVGPVKYSRLDLLFFDNEAELFTQYNPSLEDKVVDSLEAAFGDAKLIQFDKEHMLVMSKRTKLENEEYMIHKAIEREDGSIFLQDGSYVNDFSSICLIFLERKGESVSIDVPLSEEDIEFLKDGESFNWNFRTACVGLKINTRVFNESLEEMAS